MGASTWRNRQGESGEELVISPWIGSLFALPAASLFIFTKQWASCSRRWRSRSDSFFIKSPEELLAGDFFPSETSCRIFWSPNWIGIGVLRGDDLGGVRLNFSRPRSRRSGSVKWWAVFPSAKDSRAASLISISWRSWSPNWEGFETSEYVSHGALCSVRKKNTHSEFLPRYVKPLWDDFGFISFENYKFSEFASINWSFMISRDWSKRVNLLETCENEEEHLL